VLTFPRGIPGFPTCQRFVLTEIVDDGAFQLLQSIDDPEVSMVVSVPWLFFPDYAPELAASDTEELGLAAPEDAVVFCPVTVAPDSAALFLNLLGPFIVNSRTREGRQVGGRGRGADTRAAAPPPPAATVAESQGHAVVRPGHAVTLLALA